MRKTLGKIATVTAGILALVGLVSGTAKASESEILVKEKTPLYLEHGVLYHWTEGGTHWSHGSHSSHYSSSR